MEVWYVTVKGDIVYECYSRKEAVAKKAALVAKGTTDVKIEKD